MNPQTLLNRPKPQIVPKITKISGLVDSSNEIKKSSTKLRKVFENGTYQKKTQLATLNRYKKRLDAIQKQNDKKFSEKSKVKIKLPDIKKYAGSFFTAGSTNDPLKSIAALAAFNSASKAGKGDWLGAVGPGLVAAGLLFGPGLIKKGVGKMFGGGKASSQSAPSIISGSPYSQTKAGKAYAGMQAERNLPKWAQKAVGGSSSRFAASNEKVFQGTANIGDRARVLGRRFGFGGIGGAAENIAAKGGGAATTRAGGTIAAKLGGVGARAVPLLGTALNIGLSAYRFSQGDVVGGILSAVSAIPVIGWAALGVDLAREFGAFDGTILGRKDQLKEQTQKQKELTKKKESGGELTFRKTLNSYEKSVNKFEQFSKNFKGAMGMSTEQTRQTAARIEDLGGGSTPSSAAGYEFTNNSSFSQYLTGDVNAPQGIYDPSHGTRSNYHDHLAFKDKETATRAYNFLKSKGIKVTELGVSKGHTAGSAHYVGRAFDVPGRQWGGGPNDPITQDHYRGSAKVRAFMNDFYNLETQRTNQPSSNSFNLEIHSVGPNEKQRSGLMASYIDPETGMAKSLKSEFGSYARNFRGGDLGGPTRGLNLIETDMKKGVDLNAKKIFNIIKANPNQQVNLFAGHNDVTKGETGTSGEQKYTREVSEKVIQLARAAGLKNVTYYPSIIANDDNDPNANWNRAARLRGGVRPQQNRPPQNIPQSNIQITTQQRSRRSVTSSPSQRVYNIPYPVVTQQQSISSTEESMPMIIGPSEQDLLNSFYKRVLLNTV